MQGAEPDKGEIILLLPTSLMPTHYGDMEQPLISRQSGRPHPVYPPSSMGNGIRRLTATILGITI